MIRSLIKLLATPKVTKRVFMTNAVTFRRNTIPASCLTYEKVLRLNRKLIIKEPNTTKRVQPFHLSAGHLNSFGNQRRYLRNHFSEKLYLYILIDML